MSIPRAVRWAFAALVALVVCGPAPMANAQPTVPGEVALYISTELIDDLNEFYGPGTGGDGRLFTNTTTVSVGVRVFEFTSDFLNGVDAEPSVRRLNEWVSVVSIDEAPVGFVIVSIEALTASPQLATFTSSSQFGIVVAAMTETSHLVRDSARTAWFSLNEETLTPLVAGSSGITEPTTLEQYRGLVAAQGPGVNDDQPAPARLDSGLIIAGLILVLIVLLLALEAFLPYWRARAKRNVEMEAELEPGSEPEPEPDPIVAGTRSRAPRKKPTESA